MFGKKQKRIESLEAVVTFWQGHWERTDKARKDAVENLLTSVNSNRDYEARIDTLDFALSESKGMAQALEDENRDLVRQLDLLRALLSQVRVNVTLPAKPNEAANRAVMTRKK